jgi:hypothetical protein
MPPRCDDRQTHVIAEGTPGRFVLTSAFLISVPATLNGYKTGWLERPEMRLSRRRFVEWHSPHAWTWLCGWQACPTGCDGGPRAFLSKSARGQRLTHKWCPVETDDHVFVQMEKGERIHWNGWSFQVDCRGGVTISRWKFRQQRVTALEYYGFQLPGICRGTCLWSGVGLAPHPTVPTLYLMRPSRATTCQWAWCDSISPVWQAFSRKYHWKANSYDPGLMQGLRVQAVVWSVLLKAAHNHCWVDVVKVMTNLIWN